MYKSISGLNRVVSRKLCSPDTLKT